MKKEEERVKKEERVCETMINGYLCAISHYNVHVHVYRCKCNNYALYNDDCTDNAAMTKDKH